MAQSNASAKPPPEGARRPTRVVSKRLNERVSFYVWTAIVLAVAVTAVILGWHARGGTTDPTALPPGHRLSHTTVVLNSAILVLREGLETILVLAAVTASFLGGNRVYRRPVAVGGAAAVGGGDAACFRLIPTSTSAECCSGWRCSASHRSIASASRSSSSCRT